MNLFFIMVWTGGLLPAFRHARANGCGPLNSLLQATLWPADVGWHLANRFCEDHKG